MADTVLINIQLPWLTGSLRLVVVRLVRALNAPHKKDKSPPFTHFLGIVPDEAVAARLGVSTSEITRVRRAMGYQMRIHQGLWDKVAKDPGAYTPEGLLIEARRRAGFPEYAEGWEYQRPIWPPEPHIATRRNCHSCKWWKTNPESVDRDPFCARKDRFKAQSDNWFSENGGLQGRPPPFHRTGCPGWNRKRHIEHFKPLEDL